MSSKRRKKYNPNSLRRYLNPNPGSEIIGKKTPPFAMMYADLQKSWQYRALTHSARNVFVAMITESGGNFEFIFPRKVYTEYGFEPKTFQRLASELDRAGFIHQTKYYKAATVYSFSTDWLRREPPAEKTKKHKFPPKSAKPQPERSPPEC